MDNQLPIPVYMELNPKAAFPEYVMISIRHECSRTMLTILESSDHTEPVQNCER